MKKILGIVLLSLLCFSIRSGAQNTTVTATVVDSDSTAWANGTWSFSLIPSPNNPNVGTYTIGGSALSPTMISQTGSMDGSGVLSITTYQSNAISPGGTLWALALCPNASVGCSVYQFSTGSNSSMNISSALTAFLSAPRFSPVSGAYGYNTTEAALSLRVGSTFWNVTNTCTETYGGVSWSCPTGSGLGTVTTVSVNTANGVSGTVTNPTTTPAITLILGAITPTSTNGVSAATMAFMDATSSVQTQLNAKLASATAAATYAPIFTLTTTGSSGPATYSGNVLNIPQYAGGGSMTWPSTPGISVCTGTPCTAWGTSLVAPSGTIVGTTDTQTLTNKTVDGVSPITFGFVDATSSIQTQLNGKQASLSLVAGTYVNNDWCSYLTSGTLLNCNNAAPQAQLNLVKGTYVDGDACTYTASGTVLNCNTAVSGGGNTTSTSLTTNALPKANGANSIINSLFTDDGTTGSYSGTGGITASNGPLVSGLPAGGVGSSLYLKQEGTIPTGLSAAAQDNCYSDSTQHGILCNFNAGTTLPITQGPASDTSGHVASWSGTNGGKLADGGAVAANLVTASSPGIGVCHFAGSTQACTSSAVALGSADVSGVLPNANGGRPAISNTTFTNATTAISGNACSASAVTMTMTGLTTSSVILITPSTDVSGSTGWGSSGGLVIDAWPTSNTLNYKICNQTSGSITPAAVTWNVGAQ